MSTAENANQVERKHFSISREMDFFTESELVKQTGHAVEDWPLVIVKELIDNALDACEEAKINPYIRVDFMDEGIFVRDNGPGIPASVIRSMLDFKQRVSSRSAYVAPDRGRQGNALKTLVAIPFVLSGNSRGSIVVQSRNTIHEINVGIDHVRQIPEVTHNTEVIKTVGTGVLVTLPAKTVDSVKDDLFVKDSPRSLTVSQKSRFLPLLQMYAMLNPHMSLHVYFATSKVFSFSRTMTCGKWLPSNPTDPAWYEAEDLRKLIAANIGRDSDSETVREFLAQFRGLKSTTKRMKIMRVAGLEPRMKLSGMLTKDEKANKFRIVSLLNAMKEEATPLKPKALGPIGKEHLLSQFVEIGCSEGSFQYKQISGEVDGVPWIIETAFAYCPGHSTRKFTGVNWSPAINSPFRQIGGWGLDELLAALRVSDQSPVVFLLHLICPQVKYTDHGKTNIVVGPMSAKLVVDAIISVTKAWTKQAKREERTASALARRDAMMTTRSRQESLIGVAYEVMETAYMQASNEGTLPANARQIMYAARPLIQEITGESLSDKYFTQNILPRYLEDNPIETANWDIVFDSRGHFVEPHTFNLIGLGTLDVRQYLSRNVPNDSFVRTRCPLWPTTGAQNRFSAVLFVEKEGFNPLLDRARIAEKYDIAIMSTKGMSVVASRSLIDSVCGENKIPLLVMHDFDKSGFSILGTLSKSSSRYKFRHKIRVIDLGLRLTDVEDMNLESESVDLSQDDYALQRNLLGNGALEREVEFLLKRRRVELNAMSASQLLEMLERKLVENGVKKVVPTEATLAEAYRRAVKHEIVQDQLVEIHKAASNRALETIVPAGIVEKVSALLNDNPLLPWDRAVEQVARQR